LSNRFFKGFHALTSMFFLITTYDVFICACICVCLVAFLQSLWHFSIVTQVIRLVVRSHKWSHFASGSFGTSHFTISCCILTSSCMLAWAWCHSVRAHGHGKSRFTISCCRLRLSCELLGLGVILCGLMAMESLDLWSHVASWRRRACSLGLCILFCLVAILCFHLIFASCGLDSLVLAWCHSCWMLLCFRRWSDVSCCTICRSWRYCFECCGIVT
jgi:hypothetical protein